MQIFTHLRIFSLRPLTLRIAAATALATVYASASYADPAITRPFDPAVDCTGWLDSVGSVVATGGDFNGDGVEDFAYAAPCMTVGKNARVGRIWIRSGATGKKLRKAKGRQAEMYFGAALAFVGDLNGDGKDEVAVGAPGFDFTPKTTGATTLEDAGHVRIFSRKNRLPFRKVNGAYAKADFGSSIDGIDDLDGDGVPDVIVGAPGEQRSVSDTTPVGVVHLFSGRRMIPLTSIVGNKPRQRFGTTVQNVGRFDTDFVSDFLVTSEKNPIADVENAGGLEVRSGANPEDILMRFNGAANDRLGASSASTGIDGSFIVGVPGRKMGQNLQRAGTVMAYADDRTIQFSVPSSNVQKDAQFGTGVAALGDIDGDGFDDYAGSEPFLDFSVDHFQPDLENNVGRIAFISGNGGFELFSVLGTRAGSLLGRSLAGGIDFNADGIPDLVSGNPGDSPNLRRGAGSVTIFSGVNGTPLVGYRGRRGLETRIVAAGVEGSAARVRGFRADGKRTVLDAVVFTGAILGDGELSVAHLERAIRPALPGVGRVAVGTGPGSAKSSVVVLSASKKKQVLGTFEAFPGEPVGSNVAAGDVNDDGHDDLVVAEASSLSGRVDVKIFEQSSVDPLVTTWLSTLEFNAFSGGDEIGGNLIRANGANVVVAGLKPGPGREREIIVAPVLGAPVVRVFDRFGDFLFEWLAYDLDGTIDGLSVAVGDLDGDGINEIVTAPTEGPASIRAFTYEGRPFYLPGQDLPVQFLAFPEQNTSGVRITTADVDLDNRQEILVVSRKAGSDAIRAFEANGEAVPGFSPIDPFDGSPSSVAISATDNFLPN